MASEEPIAPSDDMIWEPMLVGRPAGTHFTEARATDSYSPLARDNSTNEITTHAALRVMDDDEATEQGESHPDVEKLLVGALVAVSALLAVKTLGPPAKRVWGEHVIPALTSTWGALSRTGREEAAFVGPTAIEGVPAASELEEVAAVEDEGPGMSSAEARERLVAAIVARAFSDEQLQVLRTARIDVEGDSAPDFERALESLTPRQLEKGTGLMLKNGDPEELRDLLGLGRSESETVPLRRMRIDEPPRLTAGDAEDCASGWSSM